MTTAVVPRVSGGEEEHGHLEEFRTDPIGLMRRTREECGNVGWFQLADKHVILLSGAEANEFFFRSADDDADLRQRRCLRRQPGAAQRDAAQFCAAR
jgi:sterol 14-demethylase